MKHYTKLIYKRSPKLVRDIQDHIKREEPSLTRRARRELVEDWCESLWKSSRNENLVRDL